MGTVVLRGSVFQAPSLFVGLSGLHGPSLKKSGEREERRGCIREYRGRGRRVVPDVSDEKDRSRPSLSDSSGSGTGFPVRVSLSAFLGSLGPFPKSLHSLEQVLSPLCNPLAPHLGSRIEERNVFAKVAHPSPSCDRFSGSGFSVVGAFLGPLFS